MKILIIGQNSDFNKHLIDEIRKDNDEVFLLSKEDFKPGTKPNLTYRHYRYTKFRNLIISSIKPDIIIIGDIEPDGTYLNELSAFVQAANENNSRVIFLANGEFDTDMAEIIIKQAENHLILKADKLYFGNDFTAENKIISPIHFLDAIYAIKVTFNTLIKNRTYALCGGAAYNSLDLAQGKVLKVGDCAFGAAFSDDFGWTAIRDIADYINEQPQKKPAIAVESRKENRLPVQVVENAALFAVTLLINYLTKDSSLFAHIDFTIIYIVVISLFYNMYFIITAVVLGILMYLGFNTANIYNLMALNLSLSTLIHILEYLITGFLVGYVVTQLDTNNRRLKEDNESLLEDIEEVITINNKNVAIKDEYSKRLLTSTNSLPQLYKYVNDIVSSDLEIIYYELLSVMQKLINTDNIRIYSCNSQEGYARLEAATDITALNSLNISDHQFLKYVFENRDIYTGDHFNDEVDIVAPIVFQEQVIALIMIDDLEFLDKTLYQINLIRMICNLSANSIEQARINQQSNFIEGSRVFGFEYFNKLCLEHREKDRQYNITTTLVKCQSDRSFISLYRDISGKLRQVDTLGLNSQGELCILFHNVSSAGVQLVLNRLQLDNVEFKAIEVLD